MPAEIRYSDDGTSWLDGEVWRSRDGRYYWQDGKWKRMPTDMAEWLAAQLAAMERVVRGVRCEQAGCSDKAVGVIADARPYQDPFHASCRHHSLAFGIIWPPS